MTEEKVPQKSFPKPHLKCRSPSPRNPSAHRLSYKYSRASQNMDNLNIQAEQVLRKFWTL
jgi:hypothetical protein